MGEQDTYYYHRTMQPEPLQEMFPYKDAMGAPANQKFSRTQTLGIESDFDLLRPRSANESITESGCD